MSFCGDKWFVGADPGWEGFIVCIQPSTDAFILHPIVEERRLHSFLWAQKFGEDHDIGMIAFEQNHARPTDSKKNIWRFGASTEHMWSMLLLMGAKTTAGLTEPTATKWQNGVGIGKLGEKEDIKALTPSQRSKLRKKLSQKKAKRLYGKICPFEITVKNSDAVLLATYAKLFYRNSKISI